MPGLPQAGKCSEEVTNDHFTIERFVTRLSETTNKGFGDCAQKLWE